MAVRKDQAKTRSFHFTGGGEVCLADLPRQPRKAPGFSLPLENLKTNPSLFP